MPTCGVDWYERAGFVRNQADVYARRPDPERSISMRLDLLEGLHGQEDEALPVSAEVVSGWRGDFASLIRRGEHGAARNDPLLPPCRVP